MAVLAKTSQVCGLTVSRTRRAAHRKARRRKAASNSLPSVSLAGWEAKISRHAAVTGSRNFTFGLAQMNQRVVAGHTKQPGAKSPATRIRFESFDRVCDRGKNLLDQITCVGRLKPVGVDRFRISAVHTVRRIHSKLPNRHDRVSERSSSGEFPDPCCKSLLRWGRDLAIRLPGNLSRKKMRSRQKLPMFSRKHAAEDADLRKKCSCQTHRPSAIASSRMEALGCHVK